MEVKEAAMGKKVLTVKDLNVDFKINKKFINAVKDVDFELEEGKVLCLVGESGCGKSVTASTIMQLQSKKNSRVSGEIISENQDILKMNPRQIYELRGKKISMIFQDALTALDPVYKIGKQMMELLLAHEAIDKKEAYKRCEGMLQKVGIPEPKQRMEEYPHQLSGGMRQRVMIGMALLCNPEVLIADEPTTALDVTIQAQIIHLLKNLQKDYNTSILLITHDMGVVAGMADDVIVMYAGEIVEKAAVRDIFEEPLHPYTIDLLKSIPKLNQKAERLYSIEGTVPALGEMPQGCRFSNRCRQCMNICKQNEPKLFTVGDRKIRCWKYGEMFKGGNIDE